MFNNLAYVRVTVHNEEVHGGSPGEGPPSPPISAISAPGKASREGVQKSDKTDGKCGDFPPQRKRDQDRNCGALKMKIFLGIIPSPGGRF